MRMTSTTRRLLTLALTLGLVLVGWSGPQVALAAVTKVDVCHREGNGSYHTISVAAQAVSAHRAHGDALPGEAIPGASGYRFDDNCAPVATSICPCDLSAGGLAAVGLDAASLAFGSYCARFLNGAVIEDSRGQFLVMVETSGYSGGGRCTVWTPDLRQQIPGLPLDQAQACLNDLLAVAPSLGLACP